MTCRFCGDCETTPVGGSWRFFVPRQPPGANQRRVNAGAARFAYAKERDLWAWEIRAHRLRAAITPATGMRRVTFTRLFTGRGQLMDRINLAGGCKPLLDCLVREHLLVDDDPAHVLDHYHQRRHDVLSGLEITIEELLP